MAQSAHVRTPMISLLPQYLYELGKGVRQLFMLTMTPREAQAVQARREIARRRKDRRHGKVHPCGFEGLEGNGSPGAEQPASSALQLRGAGAKPIIRPIGAVTEAVAAPGPRIPRIGHQPAGPARAPPAQCPSHAAEDTAAMDGRSRHCAVDRRDDRRGDGSGRCIAPVDRSSASAASAGIHATGSGCRRNAGQQGRRRCRRRSRRRGMDAAPRPPG